MIDLLIPSLHEITTAVYTKTDISISLRSNFFLFMCSFLLRALFFNFLLNSLAYNFLEIPCWGIIVVGYFDLLRMLHLAGVGLAVILNEARFKPWVLDIFELIEVDCILAALFIIGLVGWKEFSAMGGAVSIRIGEGLLFEVILW